MINEGCTFSKLNAGDNKFHTIASRHGETQFYPSSFKVVQTKVKTECNSIFASRPSLNISSYIDKNHTESNLRFSISVCRTRLARNGNWLQTPAQDVEFDHKKLFIEYENMISLKRSSILSRVEKSLDRLKGFAHYASEFRRVLRSAEQDQPIAEEKTKSSQQQLNINPEHLNAKEFYKLATENKTAAVALQDYVVKCPLSQLDTIVNLALQHVSNLLTDKYGSYVLQRLCERSQLLLVKLQPLCLNKFDELVSDEFGSRLLQTIAELSQAFREIAFDRFCAKWEANIRRNSSVFFLCAFIKSSASQKELARVHGRLLKEPEKMLASKYSKKVLVAYLEKCDDTILSVAFSAVVRQKNPTLLFEDKYCVHVLLYFVQRQYLPAITMLITSLNSSVWEIFSRRYARLFFMRLRPHLTLQASGELCETIKSLISKISLLEKEFVQKYQIDLLLLSWLWLGLPNPHPSNEDIKILETISSLVFD